LETRNDPSQREDHAMNVRTWSVFFILLGSPSFAHAEEQLQFEPTVVRITGVLHIEPRPTDPDDSPLQKTMKHIIVLRLDSPVTVIGNPNDVENSETYDHVRRIQLAYGPPLKLVRYAGHHMTLEGKLFTHISAYHYTKVLMHVVRLVKVEDKR
jgi:hypothetical protein